MPYIYTTVFRATVFRELAHLHNGLAVFLITVPIQWGIETGAQPSL